MSLSATHSCDWRPNKSKPPSGKVLLWWTNVKPYYRTAEVLLTMSKVLIFRKLTQFALVAVPLISHCWLDTAGSDRERPAALCASHVGTQPALGLSLLNPTPHPLLLNPSDSLPGGHDPWTHTSLLPHIPTLRHQWSSHSDLFWCNSPRYISCDVILKCESVVFFKSTFLSSAFFHICYC